MGTELRWNGKGEGPRRRLPGGAMEPPLPGPDDLGVHLVEGENLDVLGGLLPAFAGRVQLVYADPPYGIGQTFRTEAGEHAYADVWAGGMDSYVPAMAERLALVRELLTEDGAVFVHCDWRADAHLRLVLDDVFGAPCYRNTVTWRRAPNLGRQAASAQLGRVTDTILVYSRTAGGGLAGPVPTRRVPVPVDERGRPRGAQWDDAAGRWFTTAPRGDYTDESVARLESEGRIHRSPSGRVAVKYFLEGDEATGWHRTRRVDCLWDDYETRPLRHRPPAERLDYPTQKPEGLLERIVGWGSVEGAVVLDPFVGSGTTLAVAARLGRRAIGIDASPAAIKVTASRLRTAGVAFGKSQWIRTV